MEETLGVPLSYVYGREGLVFFLATCINKHVMLLIKLSVISFLFVNLFDTAGTLLGVASRANLIDSSGKIKNLNEAAEKDVVAEKFNSVFVTKSNRKIHVSGSFSCNYENLRSEDQDKRILQLTLTTK